MAEVYWIRKKEHTDIFSQGYVGVTSKTAQDRFKVHIDTANAKKSKKSVVHKAIKAIGAENLICETVIIAEDHQALIDGMKSFLKNENDIQINFNLLNFDFDSDYQLVYRINGALKNLNNTSKNIKLVSLAPEK